MTWIVGMPAAFGYSMGISDIRVTLANRSERDCLQKIYPVARFIALGFAGSVRIGFEMVRVMKEWLKDDNADRAWLPLETVDLWPEVAQSTFDAAPREEQPGGCHSIMLSVDPVAMNGPWPLPYVHLFRSPEFRPLRIPINKIAGIGSGSFISEFTKKLDDLSNNHESNFRLMQMERGISGGMGAILGFQVTNLIKGISPAGISSHLHYCWVHRGKITIQTNDHLTIGAWTIPDASGPDISNPQEPRKFSGSAKSDQYPSAVHFRMPKIARSWHELEEMLKACGAEARCSIA